MRNRSFLLANLALIAILLGGAPLFSGEIDQIQQRFDRPPDDARIMMRWWWFGPAVTKAGILREMQRMKEGGIGGFEVQPTYPLALDDEKAGIRNVKFMSPEFLDLLAFTAEKAHELGLRMDLTLGSGWPYGGPQFSASEAAGRLRTSIVRIKSGQPSVAVPALREGQKVIAAFIGPMQNVPAGDNPFKEVPIRDRCGPASRGPRRGGPSYVLRCRPDGNESQTTGVWRRRIRHRPLQPGRRRQVHPPDRRTGGPGVRPQPALRGFLRQFGGRWRRLDRQLPRRVPEAPRL